MSVTPSGLHRDHEAREYADCGCFDWSDPVAAIGCVAADRSQRDRGWLDRHRALDVASRLVYTVDIDTHWDARDRVVEATLAMADRLVAWLRADPTPPTTGGT